MSAVAFAALSPAAAPTTVASASTATSSGDGFAALLGGLEDPHSTASSAKDGSDDTKGAKAATTDARS